VLRQRHGAMNMQAIETILFANTERIAVAVVCLIGAGFMIRFLIALSLDGRRTCARSETSRSETIRQDAAL